MLILLFLLLAAVAAAAFTVLFQVVRGRNKRLLLAGTYGTTSDAPDGIGISVLCSGVRTLEQIENLLAVEYARYEVVVVLDALRYSAEFSALAVRYRMIRVEYVPSGELPVQGVRALGRSRKRRFRRLVLVDRVQDTPQGDFDAAAGVAAYDYLLPVHEGQYLLPDAVGRLVAEVGECGAGMCDMVRMRVGEPGRLLSREAVIAAGGFANAPWRRIPRDRRKTLWEPVFCPPRRRRTRPVIRTLLALLLAGGAGAAAWAGWWPAVAVLVTGALVWSVGGYVAQALGEVAGAYAAGFVSRRRFRRKIGEGNFTIS